MAKCDIARSRMDVRFRGKSGRAADISGTAEWSAPLIVDSFRRHALHSACWTLDALQSTLRVRVKGADKQPVCW
jgi:hypothetical protein